MLVTGRELGFELFLEDISTGTEPCPDEPPGIFPHHLPPQTVLSSMDEAGHPCWTVGHLLITLSHKISDVIGKEEILVARGYLAGLTVESSRVGRFGLSFFTELISYQKSSGLLASWTSDPKESENDMNTINNK